MASVQGPFYKSGLVLGPRTRFGWSVPWRDWNRSWYTQPRPRVKPLAFRFNSVEIKWHANSAEYGTSCYDLLGNPFTGIYQRRVYRSAYAKFLNDINSDSAELLTAFCEAKKSATMIADRTFRLAYGFMAVLRRDKKTLKRLWGNRAGWREHAREKGSHILEYSFGWAPLVADIASAIAVLKEGEKRSGKVAMRSNYLDSYSYDSGVFNYTDVWKTTLGVRMGWDLRIEHPSIALAAQLGLTNPVQTAWELVPFSFVVDYFVNVNDVISSMTALAGCVLENEWNTSYHLTHVTHIVKWRIEKPPWVAPSYGGEICNVVRDPGITRPSLGLRAPWNMSWARAATSIALLLQLLKG